ncbi:hypothetical protein LguiB_004982 [Lonicera macranthoides]
MELEENSRCSKYRGSNLLLVLSIIPFTLPLAFPSGGYWTLTRISQSNELFRGNFLNAICLQPTIQSTPILASYIPSAEISNNLAEGNPPPSLKSECFVKLIT